MTLAVAPERPEHFVFTQADWEFYDKALRVGAAQRIRITYDRGRMEVMTHSDEHEALRSAAGRILEYYARQVRVRLVGRGNVTCRREDLDRGLEPDECYYVVNRPVRDADGQLDLTNGPPPDLAVEIEVSRTVIPRRPIYLELGVPELWRIDRQRTTVLRLHGGEYQEVERSGYLPQLDMALFHRLVRVAVDEPDLALDELDAWIKSRNEGQQK
jgi:Uma2 family endonuclease